MSRADKGLDVVVCVRPGAPDDVRTDDARVLGPLDARAIDYAVRLHDQVAGSVRVVAVAAGGADAAAVLRECRAMGADGALHVELDATVTDPTEVAEALAAAVAGIRPDLVLCGTRSEVGMHGVVPRALAVALEVPYVGSVVELTIDDHGDRRAARAVQRLERGDRWAWGSDLPLVCGVERDICNPRYLAALRLQRAASTTPTLHRPETGSSTAVPTPLVVEAKNAPRIRPKKSKAPPSKAMTAADRMKMLRGGGKAPTAAGGDDDTGPRRFSGDASSAAAEIVNLLEKHELL